VEEIIVRAVPLTAAPCCKRMQAEKS
jgi:hypothetical protein